MVGSIGLGCMSFAGFYGATDRAVSHRTLARALELGVTHLDTALIYGAGLSEEVVGDFIKDHPGRFTIATKGGIRTQPVRSFDNSEGFLRESLEASLRRLGVEHVELYYIHRRDQTIPIEDVVGTLLKFKEEGKIGGIGFSEIAPASLERAAAIHPVMAVQSEYSLWTRLPELGMIQACERLGTAFVAFSPVGRGMFGARPLDPAGFAETDFRKSNPRFTEPNFSANEARIARFRAFARERGISPATLAIAWTLNAGEHVIPIPGTRSPEHLAEDAKAAEITLTAGDLAAIEAILPAGFAHGDRYSQKQAVGPENYC
ncbi:aldo/keto reductase [Aurantimonas sp. VKM B-3413]|uniref:aldo/keto reductase n=1 Tax=Aurantimonas sp. VKM B-3413 TaxID=2779401 RepID=UPI001E548FB5|nr:aldo/keto reductase [Aurantimonas sp. VKM B-3413]MCB8840684.1 aldo/keto reductase [Aurantimonas sp. VKM B-3413]